MKEHGEEKWLKKIFATLSLLMCCLSLWIIWSRESTAVIVGGLAMLTLFLYTLINPFVHKIILDRDFIIEKSLFKSKKIFFKDVTQIYIDNFSTHIISNKEKITVGKFIENSGEINSYVVSKIKDNTGLLFGGDPIILQSYINDYSENKSLREFDDSNITNFTFVEKTELLESRWLFRNVNLRTSKGNFKITYFGKGMSYECVFVNDELVSKKDSNLWYVPNFNFNYQGINFSVNVKVYPWMTIRKFWIEVEGKTVYSE